MNTTKTFVLYSMGLFLLKNIITFNLIKIHEKQHEFIIYTMIKKKSTNKLTTYKIIT